MLVFSSHKENGNNKPRIRHSVLHLFNALGKRHSKTIILTRVDLTGDTYSTPVFVTQNHNATRKDYSQNVHNLPHLPSGACQSHSVNEHNHDRAFKMAGR